MPTLVVLRGLGVCLLLRVPRPRKVGGVVGTVNILFSEELEGCARTPPVTGFPLQADFMSATGVNKANRPWLSCGHGLPVRLPPA